MPRPENDIGFGPFMPPVRGRQGIGRDTDVFPTLSGLTLVSSPYTDGKGRTVSKVVASWTTNPDPLPKAEQANKTRHLVSWSVSGGSAFNAERSTESNTITIDNLPVEVTFTFRVRYKAADGKTGPFLTGSVTTKADNVPPPQPTKPTLTATFKGVAIRWDGQFHQAAARPSDFKYVQAWASPNADLSGAQPAGQLAQAGETAVMPVFAGGATKIYVYLVAHDRSDNISPKSEVAETNVLTKVPPDIAKFSLTDEQFADLTLTSRVIGNEQIINSKIGENAVKDRQIAAGAVRAAKTDLDGIDPNSGKISVAAIDTLQLRARSIIAEKIQTDEVITRHLNAETITFDEIAGNAIFAHHITTRAISSEKIDTNAVIAGKIAAGAITASSLSVASLSPDFVKNGSFEDNFDSWNTNYEPAGGQWYITDQAGGFTGKLTAFADNPGSSHCAIGSTPFPVKAGELWYVQCYAQALIRVGRIYLRAVFYNEDGNYAGYHDFVAHAQVFGNIGLFDGQVTIPGGVNLMQVVVYAYKEDSGQGWQMKLDDVSARRVTLSAHIGNGEIKTPLLKAEAVTSLKVETNSLTSEQIGGGSIRSDELFSTAVTSKVVTGGLIRTASDGLERVEMRDTIRDAIRWIGGGSNNPIHAELRGRLGGETADPQGNVPAGLYINSHAQLGSEFAGLWQVGKRKARNRAPQKVRVRADHDFMAISTDDGKGRVNFSDPMTDGPSFVIATLSETSSGEHWVWNVQNFGFNGFDIQCRILSSDPNRNGKFPGKGSFCYVSWYVEIVF